MRPEKEVLGGEVTGQYPDQMNRAIAMSAFEARIAAVIRVGLTLLGISSLLVATPASAQPAKIHRVGFLASGGSTASANLVQSFRDGLRELGWIEHKNFVIDYRFAEGRFERLPRLADELIRSNVDLVLAATTPAAVAARNATSTIPVVMASVADPVGLGLIKSIARPGGNITGVAYSFDHDIFTKQLQLLKEAVPTARRVAILSNPASPSQALIVTSVKRAAESLRLTLQFVEARALEDFPGAFARMSADRADALLVVSDSMFGTYAVVLADLATRHRLPSMHGARANVEAGGLMLYGPNIPNTVRQAAAYVDKILKGAKPADLAVEQPTRFDLVVNMKTAKALGLAIPPAILLRANQVLE